MQYSGNPKRTAEQAKSGATSSVSDMLDKNTRGVDRNAAPAMKDDVLDSFSCVDGLGSMVVSYSDGQEDEHVDGVEIYFGSMYDEVKKALWFAEGDNDEVRDSVLDDPPPSLYTRFGKVLFSPPTFASKKSADTKEKMHWKSGPIASHGSVASDLRTCTGTRKKSKVAKSHDVLDTFSCNDGFGSIVLCDSNDDEIEYVNRVKIYFGSMYDEVRESLSFSEGISDNVGAISRLSIYQRIDRLVYPPPLKLNAPPHGKIYPNSGPIASLGKAASSAVASIQKWREPDAVSHIDFSLQVASDEVLLHGTETADAHHQKIQRCLEMSRGLHGADGLKHCGFDFRFVPCPKHIGEEWAPDNCEREKLTKEKDGDIPVSLSPQTKLHDTSVPDHGNLFSCLRCSTCLFHIQSNTKISPDNLNRFIAHGKMYDEVARLCQEYAQEMIRDECDLEWTTLCDDESKGSKVRALVDKDLAEGTGPVLLVATGKGKVKAGVFSRHHLLTGGVERSTAIMMVREAKKRKMRVAIIDPNARGEREGMNTFRLSLGALFGHEASAEVCSDPKTSMYFNPHLHISPLYILAFSAAGGQMVRYLMEEAHSMLPRIASIAFTDSTHNIQWAREHDSLTRFLESPMCVYVRSSRVRNDDNETIFGAGESAQTDSHWIRRFGDIRTVWAGTAEHALSNFAAHHHIWEHFDAHLIPHLHESPGLASSKQEPRKM